MRAGVSAGEEGGAACNDSTTTPLLLDVTAVSVTAWASLRAHARSAERRFIVSFLIQVKR